MKVLFDYQIMCTQRFGGVSRYHVELANELNKIHGVSVEIKAMFPQNEYFCENYNRKKYMYSSRWALRMVNLVNVISTNIMVRVNPKAYDIIHPTWVFPYLNKVAGQRMVITIHDMISEVFPEGQGITRERKKQALYSAQEIIAISENTKKDILKFYPDIKPEKITVVYHGTNHLPLPKKPTHFDVPKDYVLFVGKRADYKNGILLMNAFSNIHKSNKNIKLVYIGGGSFTNDEANIIKELGIEDCTYQYSVSDAELAYMYSHAICFVYPSLYEGFGFPILEAFDNRCPVVCAKSSCLPEVGGDAVVYFDPTNSKELSIRIMELINHEEDRRKLIVLGNERVKLFTWKKTAQETLEVYKKVLGE